LEQERRRCDSCTLLLAPRPQPVERSNALLMSSGLGESLGKWLNDEAQLLAPGSPQLEQLQKARLPTRTPSKLQLASDEREVVNSYGRSCIEP
ncbi:MAG: hypothetical protein SGPRY_010877, partial [Prymnesium sp.]